MDNKELIKKYLERWEGLQVASIQYYAETGKISGFLYLAINKMLEEKAKEAYNQGVRDAAESAKMKFHDGFHKENKDIEHFQSGQDNLTVSKDSILNLLK